VPTTTPVVAVPGSNAYLFNGRIIYQVAPSVWAMTSTIDLNILLYVSATLTGVWSLATGISPAPTVTQATVSDLCNSTLTALERMTLAVPVPVAGVYAINCCDDIELAVQQDGSPAGFDYDLDFGIN